MNISRFAVVILGLIMFASSFASAGSLDSPASPSDPASAMFTLEDIYKRLDTGTATAKRTGGFTEPTAGPASTGHTLNEVMTLIDSRAHATCNGTLNGTRWCDNGDGTVTDLTTGLEWLQNANCFSTEMWDNANIMSGRLFSGSCGLTDGSMVEHDWRLPTRKELEQLTTGTEQVRSGTPRAFINVQSADYWSSTTFVSGTA